MYRELFTEPISKILINHGFCSLRSALNFLQKNNVSVNKTRVLQSSEQADISKDEICINGKPLPKQKHVYILMNKPCGYVCAKESGRHPVVYDLLSSINIEKNLGTLHTIGRLDSDTEGLLLLTTNGSFSHKLCAPDFNIQKKYFVTLENSVSEEEQENYKIAFKSGITLPAEKKFGEQKVQPAKLQFLNESDCVLTISEGKFHQVKRMFLAVNNKVLKLKRIQFGTLKLDKTLLPGEWRFLEQTELESLADSD